MTTKDMATSELNQYEIYKYLSECIGYKTGCSKLANIIKKFSIKFTVNETFIKAR